MQCLEVSGAVRLIYRSLGVKGLKYILLSEARGVASIILLLYVGQKWAFTGTENEPSASKAGVCFCVS